MRSLSTRIFPLRSCSLHVLRSLALIISPNLKIELVGRRHFKVRGKFGPGQFRFNPGRKSAAEIQQGIAEAAEHYGQNLMVNVNQEGGKFTQLALPGVTHFPGNMAIGATASPDLARKVGKAQGRELRRLGITWNLGPVVEVARWPASRGIGTRSFGRDPQLTADLAAAYIEGLQSEGVAATAKHFPYLSTPIGDYHLCYPFITEAVREEDLLPFKAAIDARVASIMVAHAVFTSIDPRNISTFSRRLVTGILRDKLGFEGVIVTDSLSMRCLQGVAKRIGIGEMAVRAFEAGADIVLIEPDLHKTTSDPSQEKRVQLAAAENQIRALEAFMVALSSGRIAQRQIEEAAGKIKNMSSRFSLRERPDITGAILDQNEGHRRLAYEVAARGVSTKDANHILPFALVAEDELTLVLPELAQTSRADNSPSTEADLEGIIRKYHQNLRVFRLDNDTEELDLERIKGSRLILVRTYYGYLEEKEFLLQRQILQKLSSLSIPIVLICAGSPLDAERLSASAYVMCYSVAEASYRAAVDILFGKRKVSGVVSPFLETKPAQSTPKVTVIMPSTGEKEILATLDLVKRECGLLREKGFETQIIVGLNNLSGKKPEDTLRKIKARINGSDGDEVRYLPDATGKFDAMRLVAESVDPENLVIFVDDDIAFVQGSLLAMVKELSQRKEPYLVGATPLALEPPDFPFWQDFWTNTFAIKRRYALNLFRHPSLPAGSLLGLKAEYFPKFQLEGIPADINDSFVLVNSFFPNVGFCEGAGYYQGLSTSPAEELFRRLRVTKGARIAAELFPFPFLSQVARKSRAERVSLGAARRLRVKELVLFGANTLFEIGFRALYPYLASRTGETGWHMSHGSRERISEELWERLYCSKPLLPPLPPPLELESDPFLPGPYQIYPEE